MSTYLAADRISQYAEAKARREALLAETELLERHLSQTDVKSDIDGIVLSGDLRQHIGRPVRLGEQLLVVAPLEKLVLQVDIAQQDIAYVDRGQEGQFTTKAAPDDAMSFELNKVLPAPIVRDGASVYLAEAVIDNEAHFAASASLAAMKADGVPDDLLVRLESIVGVRFPAQSEFRSRLVELLPSEELSEYEAQILKHVRTDLGALRSGMEGVGKIKVSRENVTWVASRKLVNWIQLHLWW